MMVIAKAVKVQPFQHTFSCVYSLQLFIRHLIILLHVFYLASEVSDCAQSFMQKGLDLCVERDAALKKVELSALLEEQAGNLETENHKLRESLRVAQEEKVSPIANNGKVMSEEQ